MGVYLNGKLCGISLPQPNPTPTKKYQLLDRVENDNGNEIGSVSGFFTDGNGVEYAVVCLDAQYRITSDTYGNGKISSGYIAYGNGSTYLTPTLLRTRTATTETDAILTAATAASQTSSGANHCRSKSFVISGTTYYGQIPNIQEVIDIMEIATDLNSADTSGSSYSSWLLPEDPNKANNIWSSTPSSSAYAWTCGTTQIGSMTTNNDAFIVPVLEIPNA